jgi:hypothetical protein
MNAAYGEPKGNLPFNLGHRKFPIQYTLPEGSTEEVRKTVRIVLSKQLESAIRMVFERESSDVTSNAKAAERPRTALDQAEDYANEIEYQNAIKLLGYGEGLERVRANVRNLFTKVEEYCAEIRERSRVPFEFEARNWNEREIENFCAVRGRGLSMSFGWLQPYAGTDSDAFLFNIQFQGEVIFPSEVGRRMHLEQPKKLKTKTFLPWLSRDSEIGWAERTTGAKEATFISNADLVDLCFSDFLKLLQSRSR